MFLFQVEISGLLPCVLPIVFSNVWVPKRKILVTPKTHRKAAMILNFLTNYSKKDPYKYT